MLKRYYVSAYFVILAEDAEAAANIVQNAVEATSSHYETDYCSAEENDGSLDTPNSDDFDLDGEEN